MFRFKLYYSYLILGLLSGIRTLPVFNNCSNIYEKHNKYIIVWWKKQIRDINLKNNVNLLQISFRALEYEMFHTHGSAHNY